MSLSTSRILWTAFAALNFALPAQAQEDPPHFEFPYQDILDPTNGTDHGQFNATRLILKFDWSQFVANRTWTGPYSALVSLLLTACRPILTVSDLRPQHC